jgi:DNA processing protein
LVTDYPPGTAPLAVHFIRRNRIIAGLSHATILVESKIKGGGLITARLAFSYGRDVYALPGRADDLRSQGCNMLIRNKMAEPLISTENLMESLGLNHTISIRKDNERLMMENRYINSVQKDDIGRMAEILVIIRKKRGISIEDLSYETGMEYSRTAHLAGILETDGFISIDLMQRCTINSRF